jgi:hypothetical protein
VAQSIQKSAESGTGSLQSIETSKFVVTQPARMQELNNLLQTFESLPGRISERTGEDRSGDMGGGGGFVTSGSGQGDDTHVSARDAAIAGMPQQATVLRAQLTKHIRSETRKLERLADRISYSNKPGTAHKLNSIYSKIRRLNILIAEIFESSIDILKKLFIRVFIDKQSIL